MVLGRPLRPVEPRGNGDGTRRNGHAQRSASCLRVAHAHATTRRLVAQLLPRGQHRERVETRLQRVRLRRGGRLAPLAVRRRSCCSRTFLADGRARDGIRSQHAPQGRHRALGQRGRCGAVVVCAAHGQQLNSPLTALRRKRCCAARRTTAALACRRGCHRRGDQPLAGVVRTQGSLGDGLVLPRARWCTDRRRREVAAQRQLGHLLSRRPRHPLRQRRTVGHCIRNRRMCHRIQRNRRPANRP